MPKADDYRPLELVEPVTTERRYTLDEFEVLAKQWLDEFQVTGGGTEWAISHLIQYLKKREREVG